MTAPLPLRARREECGVQHGLAVWNAVRQPSYAGSGHPNPCVRTRDAGSGARQTIGKRRGVALGALAVAERMPRIVVFVTVADLRVGLFPRRTLPARRGWKFNRRERWRGLVACHGPGSFFARAPALAGPPILRQLARGFTPPIVGNRFQRLEGIGVPAVRRFFSNIAPSLDRSLARAAMRAIDITTSGGTRRLRRRCVVHLLCDVIASRSRDLAPAGRSRPLS